jgi:hypothetical protein
MNLKTGDSNLDLAREVGKSGVLKSSEKSALGSEKKGLGSGKLPPHCLTCHINSSFLFSHFLFFEYFTTNINLSLIISLNVGRGSLEAWSDAKDILETINVYLANDPNFLGRSWSSSYSSTAIECKSNWSSSSLFSYFGQLGLGWILLSRD